MSLTGVLKSLEKNEAAKISDRLFPVVETLN
jgi:hypothetical protein